MNNEAGMDPQHGLYFSFWFGTDTSFRTESQNTPYTVNEKTLYMKVIGKGSVCNTKDTTVFRSLTSLQQNRLKRMKTV